MNELILVDSLISSFPKMRYHIMQAADYGDLDKVINLIFSLETDLMEV